MVTNRSLGCRNRLLQPVQQPVAPLLLARAAGLRGVDPGAADTMAR